MLSRSCHTVATLASRLSPLELSPTRFVLTISCSGLLRPCIKRTTVSDPSSCRVLALIYPHDPETEVLLATIQLSFGDPLLNSSLSAIWAFLTSRPIFAHLPPKQQTINAQASFVTMQNLQENRECLPCTKPMVFHRWRSSLMDIRIGLVGQTIHVWGLERTRQMIYDASDRWINCSHPRIQGFLMDGAAHA